MIDQPLDPRSLANYILLTRRHFGYATTNLEMQKLSYFCYANFWKRFDRKLIEGNFEAWEHGPVHPMLYREFKEFGAAPITRYARQTNLITGESRRVGVPRQENVRSFVVETILQLRNLSASQLREKSHEEGSAWHSVWTSAKKNLASSILIPDSVVREESNRHMLAVVSEFVDSEVPPFEDFPPEFD